MEEGKKGEEQWEEGAVYEQEKREDKEEKWHQKEAEKMNED